MAVQKSVRNTGTKQKPWQSETASSEGTAAGALRIAHGASAGTTGSPRADGAAHAPIGATPRVSARPVVSPLPWILAFAVMFVGGAAALIGPAALPVNVKVLELVQNKSKYDGRLVRIRGMFFSADEASRRPAMLIGTDVHPEAMAGKYVALAGGIGQLHPGDTVECEGAYTMADNVLRVRGARVLTDGRRR